MCQGFHHIYSCCHAIVLQVVTLSRALAQYGDYTFPQLLSLARLLLDLIDASPSSRRRDTVPPTAANGAQAPPQSGLATAAGRSAALAAAAAAGSGNVQGSKRE